MSTLSQFTGGVRPTRSIVNGHSAGGVLAISLGNNNLGRQVLSGALVANTLKSLLLITGAGELGHLSAFAQGGSGHTVRCQVKVDGVVVFDATTSATANSGDGLIVVGQMAGNPVIDTPRLRFAASVEVLVAANATLTDRIAISYTAQGT